MYDSVCIWALVFMQHMLLLSVPVTHKYKLIQYPDFSDTGIYVVMEDFILKIMLFH